MAPSSRVTPKSTASSPKRLGTLGALKPGGGMAHELWDVVIGEEDGTSTQDGHNQPGPEPHTGQPPPLPTSGDGGVMHRWGGGTWPSPQIMVL